MPDGVSEDERRAEFVPADGFPNWNIWNMKFFFSFLRTKPIRVFTYTLLLATLRRIFGLQYLPRSLPVYRILPAYIQEPSALIHVEAPIPFA